MSIGLYSNVEGNRLQELKHGHSVVLLNEALKPFRSVAVNLLLRWSTASERTGDHKFGFTLLHLQLLYELVVFSIVLCFTLVCLVLG